MRTKSAYIVGGAGTGKSTFTAQVLAGVEFGPLEDLHQKPNSRGTVITLRGHRLPGGGLYLGCMREEFPGTDGLDRVSCVPGEDWLRKGELPRWIIGEGATLATRGFISDLSSATDLLLVHLWTEDWLKELRLDGRGSDQAETFVTGTATRSRNLVRDMEKKGVKSLEVDTGDPRLWETARSVVQMHLGFA